MKFFIWAIPQIECLPSVSCTQRMKTLAFDADGERRHGYEVVGYMPATEFAAHLRKTFD